MALLFVQLLSLINARIVDDCSDLRHDIKRLVGDQLEDKVSNVLGPNADPCDKLELADKIFNVRPLDKQVLDVARRLVNAEQSFSTKRGKKLPQFCTDKSLPKNKELRGILALVSDEGLAVKFGSRGGLTMSETNSLAKKTLKRPFDATGTSVAQLYYEAGFDDFVGSNKFTHLIVPQNVTTGTLTYTGTGCPTNTAGFLFAPDTSSFTLIYDQFAATAGPGIDPKQSRAQCEISAQPGIPKGYKYSVISADLRGFVQLPSKGTAKSQVSYTYAGATKPLFKEERKFSGPTDAFGQDFVFSTRVPDNKAVWSQCGNSPPFKIGNSLEVNVPSGTSGQIVYESLDAKVQQVVGLKFRRCHPE